MLNYAWQSDSIQIIQSTVNSVTNFVKAAAIYFSVQVYNAK